MGLDQTLLPFMCLIIGVGLCVVLGILETFKVVPRREAPANQKLFVCRLCGK